VLSCCPPLAHLLLTVIVAIIAGVILLIWNDKWMALIRQCPAMKSLGPGLALIHSPVGPSRWTDWRITCSNCVSVICLCVFRFCSPARPSIPIPTPSSIASALVRNVLYFFSTTPLPAFRNLRRATAASPGSASGPQSLSNASWPPRVLQSCVTAGRWSHQIHEPILRTRPSPPSRRNPGSKSQSIRKTGRSCSATLCALGTPQMGCARVTGAIS
jgi:hypothetical protein